MAYSKPIAYHLTWGTYGTRLHGDPRGSVDRTHNDFGEPVIEFDKHRWSRETSLLKFAAVSFDVPKMQQVELLVPSVCMRGGWHLHTCAAGPDHVHVLLQADAEPKAVRRMLKRWLGQALDEQHSRADGSSWWAECGSAKVIFEREYFDAAFDYIKNQRATPAPQ